MYNLADLDFEPTENISEIQTEEILVLRDQLWMNGSHSIQAADLDEILTDEFYYVGTEHFVVKGKSSFYKGLIVVAAKDKLIEYLIRIIRLDDARSVFILPKNQQNMLLRLDDEGSLMLYKHE
ncbi:hypothetical protein [Acinetobacter sp. CFCC 10889]|uniref:hypothetical protein n=1 Tax=Acinetobacter sp. CFCC 10889 TaxID=1775557 RepID=UPI000DD0DB84|nr:hypothetical protein [Acinetobacter sp. CFCC 10889]